MALVNWKLYVILMADRYHSLHHKVTLMGFTSPPSKPKLLKTGTVWKPWYRKLIGRLWKPNICQVVVTRILQVKLYIWMEEPHNRAGRMALFNKWSWRLKFVVATGRELVGRAYDTCRCQPCGRMFHEIASMFIVNLPPHLQWHVTLLRGAC